MDIVSMTVPAMAFFINLSLPAPKLVAIIMANPLVNPLSRLFSKSHSDVVEPTAARALSPSMEPTILVSTRL